MMQRLHRGRYSRGFTIVELLVVVVVIAIIAAVVQVSFAQVRISAENAKTQEAVSQFLKGVLTYSAQNGTYPITATYPCVGTQTTCARVSGTTTCFGIGTAVYSQAFNDIMSGVITPLPEPSTQTMDCGGNKYRGAYYNKNDTSNGKSASMVYFLRGNQVCTLKYGTLVSTFQEDTTRCSVSLPNLPS